MCDTSIPVTNMEPESHVSLKMLEQREHDLSVFPLLAEYTLDNDKTFVNYSTS